MGLFKLQGWDIAFVALALTHVTIAAVTIFLHRHQAHRTLDLHPAVSHFFRFWLWLTTGMITREWVAIHRKHHARCETPDDPHSPQVQGIRKVLLEGAELYRNEARSAETLETYGRGTPDDWLERRLYAAHPGLGIAIMLAIDVVLFGPIGLTIWAVQMLWIPIFAAGVINGIGHYWGYRRFAPNDASRNILPWGILIGGEELHNNHHAYTASARLSSTWWEFDIGWLYIRTLEILRLAKVRRVAPRLRITPGKSTCDAGTLRAICTHRYLVLGQFARLLKRTASKEIRQTARARTIPAQVAAKARRALSRWLEGVADTLPEAERSALDQVLRSNAVLQKIFSMRRELAALWSGSTIGTRRNWWAASMTGAGAPTNAGSRDCRNYRDAFAATITTCRAFQRSRPGSPFQGTHMKRILSVLLSFLSFPAFAALEVGDAAPDFTTQASLGGKEFTYTLSTALKEGPVVLYFYPAAFTSGCTIEAHLFAEAIPEFKELGASVIGVSNDTIETLNKFSVSECRSRFPVASDQDQRIMKSYDAVFLWKTSYASRTSYVITPDGQIAYRYTNLSPDEHVKNTLSALREWKAAKK